MVNLPNIVEIIKKAAVDAVTQTHLIKFIYGTVMSIEPIKINIEQKLTLEAEDIILTDNVRESIVDITLEGIQRAITIHNGLRVGEQVLMIQMQGGQRYVVLNRVVSG